MMFTQISKILLASGAGLLGAILLVNAEPTAGPSAAALVGSLDECIQIRFKAEEPFGMARIMPATLPRAHAKLASLVPETKQESWVAEQLEKSHTSVLIYLAGAEGEQEVRGPVLVGSALLPAEPPSAETLRTVRQQALHAFSKDSRYDSVRGSWRVVARPVRAAKAECIQCHLSRIGTFDPLGRPRAESRLKLGDPLGALIYAYQGPSPTDR